MKTAYLGLGSNLGDRQANLAEALALLASEGIRIVRRSSLYETDPRDFEQQPLFLNMTVEVETALFPLQLMSRIDKIERVMGRTRTIAKGPRLIDIDILLYGSSVINTARLQVPHPRMTERRFVLEPLAEIAPDLKHPFSQVRIRDLLKGVAAQGVRRWPEPQK